MSKLIGNRYLVGLVLFLNLPGFANSVSRDGYVQREDYGTCLQIYPNFTRDLGGRAKRSHQNLRPHWNRDGLAGLLPYIRWATPASGLFTPCDAYRHYSPIGPYISGDPSTLWRCNAWVLLRRPKRTLRRVPASFVIVLKSFPRVETLLWR